MRRIERTAQFKKDYKREMKGEYRSILEAVLIEVLALLVSIQNYRRDIAITL